MLLQMEGRGREGGRMVTGGNERTKLLPSLLPFSNFLGTKPKTQPTSPNPPQAAYLPLPLLPLSSALKTFLSQFRLLFAKEHPGRDESMSQNQAPGTKRRAWVER